jgi:hypothetical protein
MPPSAKSPQYNVPFATLSSYSPLIYTIMSSFPDGRDSLSTTFFYLWQQFEVNTYSDQSAFGFAD